MELQKNNIFAGRYKLEKRLGAGGYGEVWKAYDMVTNSHVAIKIHLKGDSKQAAQEIVKEYTRVMNIHHDNLLTPSHVGITDGVVPYLVMELCLTDLVDKVLSETDVWRLIHDVSAGLKRLAENKRPKERLDGTVSEEEAAIIHQDIKPANILVRPNKMYAISDFGISKSTLSSLTSETKDHAPDSRMTVAYAAPERFPPGVGKPVLASDIWSLGAMLYEIVEGRLPFNPDSGGESLNIERPKILIPAVSPDKCSFELRQLIYDCLSKEPSQRPHPEQLLKYSEAVLKGEPRKVEWRGAPKEIKEDKSKRKKSFSGPVGNDDDKTYAIFENISKWWQNNEKKIIRSTLTIVIVASAIVAISIFVKGRDKEWRTAKRMNTFAAYESYIENNSQGSHVVDALNKMIHLDLAEHNLEALNYVWNYSDTATGIDVSIRNEVSDSIQSYTSSCYDFSNKIVNTLSDYTFNYQYSKPEEMEKLKQLVPYALCLEIMSNLLESNFSTAPIARHSEGFCGTEYVNYDFYQPDIHRLYNETLIPAQKKVDSIFCTGRSILYDYQNYTTSDYKPYYDSAISIVNTYFSNRRTWDND